jgi:hypothetical protein
MVGMETGAGGDPGGDDGTGSGGNTGPISAPCSSAFASKLEVSQSQKFSSRGIMAQG